MKRNETAIIDGHNFVVYSPLCETSLEAYLEYLGAVKYVSRFTFGSGNVGGVPELVGGQSLFVAGEGARLGSAESRFPCDATKRAFEDLCLTSGSCKIEDSVGEDGVIQPDGDSSSVEVGGVGNVKFGLCDSVGVGSGVGCLESALGSGAVFPRGPNYERNRRNRKLKKDRKNRGVDSCQDRSDSWVRDRQRNGDLRLSLEAKWKASNELETEKKKRELEILRATDLEQEKKKHSTSIRAATERNMASIEKTHAFLKATGNVPGHVPQSFYGSAETVITPPMTISPNSSASGHEYRECLKKNADLEKENEDLKSERDRMIAAFKKVGLSFEVADAADKKTFTDTSSNHRIMDVLDPIGVIHYVKRGDKTKIKIGVEPDDYSDVVPYLPDDQYTSTQKKEWLKRYSHLDAFRFEDSSIHSIKLLGNVSLAEVRKYSKFRFELGLSDRLITEEL